MKKLIMTTIVALSLSVAAQAEAVVCKVMKSTPIYEEQTIRVPKRILKEVAVTSKVPCGYTYEEKTAGGQNGVGFDTVVGMAIGGLIGNQIGRGYGNTIATVGGGLLGGHIANQHRTNPTHYNRVQKMCSETTYEQRYVNGYTYETSQNLVGYDNYFYYNGKQYKKRDTRKLTTVTVHTSINY